MLKTLLYRFAYKVHLVLRHTPKCSPQTKKYLIVRDSLKQSTKIHMKKNAALLIALPPETGASRKEALLLSTSSPISSATAGSIVLASINREPGFTVLKNNKKRL